MASYKNKSVSIKKYKNKRELNIGLFLFAVVFIYLIVTVLMYITGDNISVYEVRKGNIVKDNSYTGLMIRQETAVTAETGGYISYYQNENSKIKAGSNVYALSSEPLDTSGETGESGTAVSLNQEVQSGIVLSIQNFNEAYDSEDFSSVYSLKNDIANYLQNAFSVTRTEHLDSVIAASGQEVSSCRSAGDGIIAYSVDGCESLTADTFTEENFDRSNYERIQFEDQMQISAGEPVYRLITSEDWTVIVRLTEETAREMTEQKISSVKVRIDKDSETMRADFSVIEKDGRWYGRLDFDNSMIRYADERYLNIELILEDESGLKIPKSSVVKEQFYVVPEEYITTGGNSSSSGVMVQDKDGNASFHAVDIYNTSDDGEVYLSRDGIERGAVLVKPESTETYTVEETRPLTGVYNINRGYAVFKKVVILCENDEYYIVQEGDDYGLANYDHIVQDGSGIHSDEVVFQ